MSLNVLVPSHSPVSVEDAATRYLSVQREGERVGLSPIQQTGVAMRTTKQLSITLPISMAEALKERVASGTYTKVLGEWHSRRHE